MTPYCWESPNGNFGDDLNLWMWDCLLPGFREVHPDVLLVGIGTVLKRDLMPKGRKKLVIGSGVGYGTLPDLADRDEWDLRCVRGPLTAQSLGVDAALAVTDPAVLIADMSEFRSLPKVTEAIFIPHWQSAVEGVWQVAARAARLTYIDPCQDSKAVVRAIAQSKLVLAESMHGAILADAFRIPWIAVKTSHEFHTFKWTDWTASLALSYRPLHVPPSTRAEAGAKGEPFWGFQWRAGIRTPEIPATAGVPEAQVATLPRPRASVSRAIVKRVLAAPAMLALRQARQAPPQLSADSVLASRKERLRAILVEVRRDYL